MTRISIITAVYNRVSTIECALHSVRAQKNAEIELIVVDGMSDDGTAKVLDRNRSQIDILIQEPDDGIYDALNKGLNAASGDVIGFLHADDFFANSTVIESVARQFDGTDCEGVYGDLLYVSADDPDAVIRYWRAGCFSEAKLRWGWMPPHPTVYLRRDAYRRLGGFRTDLQIAADYEILVRMFAKHRLDMRYLEQILVKMRVGGKSNASLKNRMLANREDRRAWEINGMCPPTGLRFTKPLRKLSQYWQRPSRGG
ncbi:MAG: glycosyltransferase family 2 protein [Pirellula sp.]|jgi:glycosyltransferase involved in cell wall biosynthesis